MCLVLYICKMETHTRWKYIFIGLSIAYLLLTLLETAPQDTANWIKQLQFIIKPLLITSLGIFFFTATASSNSYFRQLMLAGLLFSVAGDTLLMFTDQGEHFFLFGLGAFLMTHICYILAFSGIKKEQKGFIIRKKWPAIPLIVFVLAFIALLWNDLAPMMRLPVATYAIVIGTMAAACLNLKEKVAHPAFLTVMAGALLFMLSDSLIALTKFKAADFAIPLPHFCIILTYLLGQYLITTGAISLHRSK